MLKKKKKGSSINAKTCISEIKPTLQEKEHADSSLQNQLNAKLQFHFPKSNKARRKKKAIRIVINKNRKEHLPGVQALHLPPIFLLVWHFHSFLKYINKIMDHNNKTGSIKTL